ncbi:probable microtubule-binding protein TANGLED [Camellia sinensis]|uniref:Microtubule-binding protein TANGLED n=1 Tax=Camellia sinensis var. sinensis TaxID=542762 RepID=A0A4S4D0L0_CAMSN|nr:probable microtubule-binding protein TANGLED [Camellia sinensis]THF95732.1 hypothetical protein TEA_025325 [Camellia sinensis var. sinensis]
MVAKTPPKQRKMVAPLNPTLLRDTVDKVDKCMERLQELQYTVSGGKKVISGVSLSPRSTRGYLRTSLRCKQESLRIKNANSRKSSPPGKLPTNTGEWRRMSLPAMLVGETVGEILQASLFARQILTSVSSKSSSDNPKTPVNLRRQQNQTQPNPKTSDQLRSRRNREKQVKLQSIRLESDSPSLQRARSRINFKQPFPENEKENVRYSANRVSPRNRPWARKTVLFPNPLFHSSPPKNHHKFCKTKSPHKFLIRTRSPPPLSLSLPPTRSTSLSKKNALKPSSSTAAKLRRSFSPSRLANRLVSPLKSSKTVQRSDDGLVIRSDSTPMRFNARRI